MPTEAGTTPRIAPHRPHPARTVAPGGLLPGCGSGLRRRRVARLISRVTWVELSRAVRAASAAGLLATPGKRGKEPGGRAVHARPPPGCRCGPEGRDAVVQLREKSVRVGGKRSWPVLVTRLAWIIHEGLRAWDKPLTRCRIWVSRPIPSDPGAHARQS